MKLLRCKVTTKAFTWVDLIIVICTIVLSLWFLVVYSALHKNSGPPIKCVSNLRQIGLAFRTFADEHGGQHPFAVPKLTNSPTKTVVTSNVITAKVWMQLQVLSNELQSAKILVCPRDRDRLNTSADDFLDGPKSLSHPAKRDLAVSYFLGLSANATEAQAPLAGDRFVGATRRDQPYSSVQARGAIRVPESSAWSDAWPPKAHGMEGNIALVDGSVQRLTTRKLQKQLAAATNAYGTNINLFLFPQ